MSKKLDPKSARYKYNWEVPSNQHSERVNSRAIPGGKKCKKGGMVVPNPHQIEISGGTMINPGRGEIMNVEESVKPMSGGKKTRAKKGGNIFSTVAHGVGDVLDLIGLGYEEEKKAGAEMVEAGKKKPRGKRAAGLFSDIAHGVGDVADLLGLGYEEEKKAGAEKVEAGKKKPRGKKAAGFADSLFNSAMDLGESQLSKKWFGIGKKKGGFQSSSVTPTATNPYQIQNPTTAAGKKQKKPKPKAKKGPSEWIKCVRAVREVHGGSYKDSMSMAKQIYYDYQKNPGQGVEEYLANHKNQ